MRLVEWLRSQEVPLGSGRTRFRDREVEVGRLLKEVGEWGVCLVYGPLGAGKSTLLRLFARGLHELEGTAAVYVNYDGKALEVLGGGLRSALGERAAQLADALAQQALGVALGTIVKLAKELLEAAARWLEASRAERVVIIHDDLDKLARATGLGKDAAIAIVDMYAATFEAEALDSLKPLIAMSDQTTVELAVKYKGKGGLEPFLLWNLPRDAFLDLAGELGSPIDGDALWRVLGGNVRVLEELAVKYRWDLEGWIAGAVSRLKRLPVERLRRWDGRPDGLLELRLDVPLLKANVLVDVSTTFRLSELPREPWVDDWYAFQLPAYYWALRAIAEKGTVKVAAKDVLRAAGLV